ncbi:MAG: hypothetical protein MZU91_12520 [Desulfosudis oleivorans]|nr:hypothetical protein [Desulfosudis oleivorans]
MSHLNHARRASSALADGASRCCPGRGPAELAALQPQLPWWIAAAGSYDGQPPTSHRAGAPRRDTVATVGRIPACAAARRRRRALIALCAVAALASVLFALRTTWSLQLLRSAYAVGAPGVSNLRPWMTLRYVATHLARARSGADRAPRAGTGTTDPATDLKTLAERDGISRLDYVQRVQAVVAELAPPRACATQLPPRRAGWPRSAIASWARLLAYGYPVLGLDAAARRHRRAAAGRPGGGGGRIAGRPGAR